MAYTEWTGSTSVSVGDIRTAQSIQASGLVFKCTVAGTTAASEPSWGNEIGCTVTDNNVTWVGISSIYKDVSSFAPDTIIELFALELPSSSGLGTYRYHNGLNAAFTGNIVFNSVAYVAIPIKGSGWELKGQGTLPRPRLTIGNLNGTVTNLINSCNVAMGTSNDLGGSKLTRIRTLAKYLDGQSDADPDAKFPDSIYYIDRKVTENRDVVTFELVSKLDLSGMLIPRRQAIANQCQWVYRSSECSYTGTNYFDKNDTAVTSAANDVCGKKVRSCKVRFGAENQLDFLQ
jgi:lambda family phage minor tail protein L